jgi:hypothetical protein
VSVELRVSESQGKLFNKNLTIAFNWYSDVPVRELKKDEWDMAVRSTSKLEGQRILTDLAVTSKNQPLQVYGHFNYIPSLIRSIDHMAKSGTFQRESTPWAPEYRVGWYSTR